MRSSPQSTAIVDRRRKIRYEVKKRQRDSIQYIMQSLTSHHLAFSPTPLCIGRVVHSVWIIGVISNAFTVLLLFSIGTTQNLDQFLLQCLFGNVFKVFECVLEFGRDLDVDILLILRRRAVIGLDWGMDLVQLWRIKRWFQVSSLQQSEINLIEPRMLFDIEYIIIPKTCRGILGHQSLQNGPGLWRKIMWRKLRFHFNDVAIQSR